MAESPGKLRADLLQMSGIPTTHVDPGPCLTDHGRLAPQVVDLGQKPSAFGPKSFGIRPTLGNCGRDPPDLRKRQASIPNTCVGTGRALGTGNGDLCRAIYVLAGPCRRSWDESGLCCEIPGRQFIPPKKGAKSRCFREARFPSFIQPSTTKSCHASAG